MERVVMVGNMYRQVDQRTSNSSPSNTSVWWKAAERSGPFSQSQSAVCMAEGFMHSNFTVTYSYLSNIIQFHF